MSTLFPAPRTPLFRGVFANQKAFNNQKAAIPSQVGWQPIILPLDS
ncbi:hypothetical protein ACUXPM_003676 [Ralstonia sp. 151470066-2]